MSDCIYCGAITNADYDHFHGSVSRFCKYGNCRMSYQNFKIRVRKNQDSDNRQLSDFANLAYTNSMIKLKPAIMWDRQLIFLRRFGNLFISVKC